MNYEITTKTTYMVDYSEFDTELEAKIRVLTLNLMGNIRGPGCELMMDAIEQNPDRIIELLLTYKQERHNLRFPPPVSNDYRGCTTVVGLKNFDTDKAYESGKVQGHMIWNFNDMVIAVNKLLAGNQKINAIKLVRNCYEPIVGLKEAKDWVEAHQESLIKAVNNDRFTATGDRMSKAV